MKEIEALQNAGNNVGLVIHEKYQEDKRRTVNKYFATLDGISISPVLDYENLNYFILGYSELPTHAIGDGMGFGSHHSYQRRQFVPSFSLSS